MLQDKLLFDNISVNFIYSFVIDELENLDTKFYRGKPALRNGILSNLSIIQDQHYHQNNFDPKDFSFEGINNQSIYEIQSLTRIFVSGAGTYTFSIKFKSANENIIDSKVVFNLYSLIQSLVPSPTAKRLGFKFKTKDFFLYEFFKNNISDTCSSNNVLCHNHGLILPFDKDNNDPQNPYCLIIAKLNDQTISLETIKRNIFNIDININDGIKNIPKELALLLYRYIEANNIIANKEWLAKIVKPNIKYFDHDEWFENLLVGVHPRSSLFLYQNNENNLELIEGLTSDFLDLFELIRGRWHFNIILNEILDSIISKISSEMRSSLNLTKEIIKNRIKYSRFLSDPLTYSFEGGLIYDISDDAQELYQLEYLKELTQKKFDIIDQLFNDNVRLDYFSIDESNN